MLGCFSTCFGCCSPVHLTCLHAVSTCCNSSPTDYVTCGALLVHNCRQPLTAAASGNRCMAAWAECCAAVSIYKIGAAEVSSNVFAGMCATHARALCCCYPLPISLSLFFFSPTHSRIHTIMHVHTTTATYLSYPVRPVHTLVVSGWVPRRVHNHDAVGSCQCKAQTADLMRHSTTQQPHSRGSGDCSASSMLA